MKNTVIFDLDGTLLNTIDDIADATNVVLEKHELPLHDIETYKLFVGNGIEVLAQKALPDHIEGERLKILTQEIKESYRKVQNTKTRPYDGIIDLLQTLNRKKVNVAVLSNKPHEFVKPTMESYFSEIDFYTTLGSREGIPPKPAPDGVYEIMNELKITKEQCLFVGDTSTDIKTGVAAGVEAVGVLWGFRKQKEMEDADASYVIQHPSDLLKLID